jgi:hypothetical protein
VLWVSPLKVCRYVMFWYPGIGVRFSITCVKSHILHLDTVLQWALNQPTVWHMERKTAHLSLRMPPKLKQAAGKAAAEDCRSLSSLIEFLLAQHCQERELLTEDRRGGRK